MEFRILGPLEIAAGGHVLPLAGVRQRGLLALLLLGANEVISADRLIEDLWSGRPPESGRTALQVRVSQLRRVLGEGGAAIHTHPPGYLLRVGDGELDLHRFEQLVREADGSDPAIAAELLREALSLWRGEPLADLAYEPFAQPAIRRLGELRLAALERRIEADLELGRHADLVAELEALVLAHPLREALRAQLMLALYRCGRQAHALAAYRTARDELVDGLGIEPSARLRDLEQAILRQDRSLELAPTLRPEPAVLVIALSAASLGGLIALAAPLARRAGTELVLVRLVDDASRLEAESLAVLHHRELLLAAGLTVRSAAFVSARRADDAVRMAAELDCSLMLIDAPPELLADPTLEAIMIDAPCDVAALTGAEAIPGPLLTPFVGADHDWTAIELGAWLAREWDVTLRLAGPTLEGQDSSRLLASASLAVQKALGVAAQPILLAPGTEALLGAARDSSLVIVGLSDRWQADGLGDARRALASLGSPPTLLVRRGLRPSGLAPRESRTRFTWSLRSSP